MCIRDRLRPAGSVDKTALDAKIAEAEALKKEEYTEETWKELEDVYKRQAPDTP